jgi:hypothetical protein
MRCCRGRRALGWRRRRWSRWLLLHLLHLCLRLLRLLHQLVLVLNKPLLYAHLV